MEELNKFLAEVVNNCTKCQNCTCYHVLGNKTNFCFFAYDCIRENFKLYQEWRKRMKYKWVIMQELEDSGCANPYLIVDTEKRAEELCYKLESENPGFIFWSYMCKEE